MLIDLCKFLLVAISLFFIGLCGIMLNRKNIILMLMSIELMLLAVNLNFIIFSVFLDDILGQVFALFVLTVAAAESAIGLAILVVYYRIRGTVSIEYINLLKN
jgi:NADH-quinone oxidoreductase subunit K